MQQDQSSSLGAVSTSKEDLVDPTLSAACGWTKPTLYFKTDSDDVGLMGDGPRGDAKIGMLAELGIEGS